MRIADIADRIRSQHSFHSVFIAIITLSFAIRLFALDLKLLHHDEAVHAWFSYRLLTEGAYVYDPSYHGPFLYYATSAIFALLGPSDFAARLLPAFTGGALVVLLYPLHRMGYLDRRQTLVAALFIALSPDMIYFSRFLRHDIFQIFFTFLLLVALIAYFETARRRYALLAAAAAALGVCCKEDMPLILIVFLIFGMYSIWRGSIRLPPHWKSTLVASLVLFTAVCAIFYSSFGVHPEVLVGHALDPSYVGEHGLAMALQETGWYRALEHWLAMHGMCRICGPWFFYIILFVLYELPIFALACVGTTQFVLEDLPFVSLGRGLRASIARFFRRDARFESEVVQEGVGRWERGWFARAQELPDRRREFFRFCIFWMLLTLAIYAWIGEKVPWLILHQLLPVTLVAVYTITPRRMAIAVLSLAFLIPLAWHVAFVPQDVNEPIVQVQNSEDLREVMRLIDASDKVVIASKNYWPLPWYYRGEGAKKIQYYGRRLDEAQLLAMDADLIIAYDAESYDSLPGYEKRTYKNAYWFSYYDQQDRLLEYYFRRDGKLGSMNWDVFVRNASGG